MAGIALPTSNQQQQQSSNGKAVVNGGGGGNEGGGQSDAQKDANATALQDYKNSALGSADAAIQQGLPLPVLQ
jgi:hypothetical protein